MKLIMPWSRPELMALGICSTSLLRIMLATPAVPIEDFVLQDAGVGDFAGDEPLGEDHAEGLGELDADLGGLAGGEGVGDAGDGAGGGGGVDGGHHEVAGFCGGEGDADGFEVAQLAEDDDVGGLPQDGAQGGMPGGGIGADFALFDDGFFVAVDELDGVFDGDDVGGAGLVDVFDDGGEGGGFSGAGGAGDEDQAVWRYRRRDDLLGDAEFPGVGDFRPDQSQDQGEVVALVMDVAAYASGGGEGAGEIELAASAAVPRRLRGEAWSGRRTRRTAWCTGACRSGSTARRCAWRASRRP